MTSLVQSAHGEEGVVQEKQVVRLEDSVDVNSAAATTATTAADATEKLDSQSGDSIFINNRDVTIACMRHMRVLCGDDSNGNEYENENSSHNDNASN